MRGNMKDDIRLLAKVRVAEHMRGDVKDKIPDALSKLASGAVANYGSRFGALINAGYIVWNGRGSSLTDKGNATLDNALEAK